MKWHGSCSQKLFRRFVFLPEHIRGAGMKSDYDLCSAITFLLVGLGIGSILAIVFNPKQRVALKGIKRMNNWRAAWLEPRGAAQEQELRGLYT
jgi:hypothetical protein